MMKRKMGLLGSYWLGLDPSKMPAWGVARFEDEGEAAAEVAAAALETREEMEDMAALQGGKRQAV